MVFSNSQELKKMYSHAYFSRELQRAVLQEDEEMNQGEDMGSRSKRPNRMLCRAGLSENSDNRAMHLDQSRHRVPGKRLPVVALGDDRLFGVFEHLRKS